jgi:hypothetical protein
MEGLANGSPSSALGFPFNPDAVIREREVLHRHSFLHMAGEAVVFRKSASRSMRLFLVAALANLAVVCRILAGIFMRIVAGEASQAAAFHKASAYSQANGRKTNKHGVVSLGCLAESCHRSPVALGTEGNLLGGRGR